MTAAALSRDPAARARAGGLLVAVVVLWPLLVLADFRPAALFDARNLATTGNFLAAFVPPAADRDFLALLLRATLETLAIATAGIALAMLIALPLALFATRTLAVSDIGPGPGQGVASAGHHLLRLLLTVLRGVPELVWALVFVRIFGLGATAGVLALALTYGGMLAKVYAEILESGDTRPARALLEAGAGRLAAMLYGLLPGAAPELTSYTVYRWECALRASVVMGFVGAGGLGQLMDQAMRMLNGGEAASILIVFLVLVLIADTLSGALRRSVAAGGRLQAAGVSVPAAAIVGGLATAVAVSFAYLDLDLASLFSRAALVSVAAFAASFLPPDLSAEWLAKIARGTLETLAISALGTLLAIAGGLLLAWPAARQGAIALPARFALNFLRSVPELVWATLTVLAVGLGPFAGVLALALHTAGVLGRLFAETLQNAPTAARDALVAAGARRGIAFAYGTLPEIAPQLIAYSLYRWEMNIRMAAILGFVGAGGLGQMLHYTLSLFHTAQAGTVIVAMLLLSAAVDAASGALRRRIG